MNIGFLIRYRSAIRVERNCKSVLENRGQGFISKIITCVANIVPVKRQNHIVANFSLFSERQSFPLDKMFPRTNQTCHDKLLFFILNIVSVRKSFPFPLLQALIGQCIIRLVKTYCATPVVCRICINKNRFAVLAAFYPPFKLCTAATHLFENKRQPCIVYISCIYRCFSTQS